jgi:hypothetical protein
MLVVNDPSDIGLMSILQTGRCGLEDIDMARIIRSSSCLLNRCITSIHPSFIVLKPQDLKGYNKNLTGSASC